MADLDNILARLIAIAGDLSGIDSAGDEYPTAGLTGNLPFVFIEEGEATYEQLDTNRVRCVREYISLIYVQAFSPENAAQEASARDAARPFLRSYPLHFIKRSRLQRSGDSGLQDITSATVSADSGLQTASRNEVLYSAVYVRHSVTYTEAVNEV